MNFRGLFRMMTTVLLLGGVGVGHAEEGVDRTGSIDYSSITSTDSETGLIVPGPPPQAERGRIIRVQDTRSVVEFRGQEYRIRQMVDSGVQSLTRSGTSLEAWNKVALPSDHVGIMIAPQGWNDVTTLVPILREVVDGLGAIGIPQHRITIWSRQIEDVEFLQMLPIPILPGSQFVGAATSGYDRDVSYESPVQGTLIWSDLDFGSEEPDAGRRSYATRLLTSRFDRVILVNSLASDASAGVRGLVYSMSYAGVDNFNRFLNPPQILAESVPEIFAMDALADKVAFCITDALIGSVAGHRPGKFHLHPPVGELWFSRDPVALDSYSLKRANHLREQIGFKPLPASSGQLLFNCQLMELGSADSDSFNIISILR